MKKEDILKRLQEIEINAQRLFEDAAALREELSGGSDSSYSKNALSPEHRQAILAKRKKNMLK
ncbi:hypothetical protein [Sediminibacter sp. Hel_I_10]|uniref:hypothetical protein n=1 Tax=Sediminibacter sp. Hel_I_10 TaxID=1392490 RepID=UPI00047DFA53|nr:hypothetical protein [Sediminibacter sp. Hel_I_10]